MNMDYLLVVIFAFFGLTVISVAVKHLRESAANARRIEREATEHRERLNRELIERLHREALLNQGMPKHWRGARAYTLAARSAAPNTAQQNSTPVPSAALDPRVENPLLDFSVPLLLANFAQYMPPELSAAEACNARSFAHDSSPSYSCDSSSSYDSSSSSSSCDSSSSSSCGGGGE